MSCVLANMEMWDDHDNKVVAGITLLIDVGNDESKRPDHGANTWSV